MRNFHIVGALIIALAATLFIPSTVLAVAPTVLDLYPVDGAVDVDIEDGINNGYIIYFDQEVVLGTGNITLKKASDDSTVEVFDIANFEIIFLDTQDLYIAGAVTLEYETDYYFLVDAGVVESVGGDPFAGIADETTWNFTTVAAPPEPLVFERVSVSSEGAEADSASSNSAVSGDGRYVAFSSDSTNLVAGDTNATTDIFVYDRDTDTIERVSVSSEGAEADASSNNSSISSDGRYVAFRSFATNLVADDTNGQIDIFVYDRTLDTIERVNLSDAGAEADGVSSLPAISGDGRFVAFISSATNLVAGDTNDVYDIFVYDRDTDTIERVSVSSEGAEANGASDDPVISSDGRYIAFESEAGNLVTGDTNAAIDIFVYDRDTDTIERVNLSDAGVEADASADTPSISSDGRYVVFSSSATNLVATDANAGSDIFVYDRDSDTIEQLNIAGGGLFFGSPFVSGNGRYVAYIHNTDDGSKDVYRYDTQTDTELYVTEGAQGNVSAKPRLSTDGLTIVFSSTATNLVDGDTNELADIFVYEETAPEPEPEDPVEVDDDDDSSRPSGRNHTRRVTSPTPTPTISPSETLSALIARLRLMIQEYIAQGGTPSPEMLDFLGGSPSSGYTRNLTIGSMGEDVKNLQLFLIAQDKGPAAKALAQIGATGYFGALTKEALAEYQASVGISPATGFFGPITRMHLNGG